MPSKPTPWPENDLRDHLATHLDSIEPDLELLEIEHHLPNPDGADGRIDILASDPSGDLVVIELKRSDQTARQALHELTKYVSLLAQAHGTPAHKLRCILLSTTWHELRVPFARFKATTDFAVDGLELLIDDSGGPVGVARVPLPIVPAGIEACPLHAMVMWATDEQRTGGLAELQAAADDVGVGDYFALICDRTPDALPSHTPYGAYLVLGRLDVEHGLLVEESCSHHFQDVAEEDEWQIEEVALSGLFERFTPGALDLSHPDQFASARDQWTITSRLAAGRYANDIVWPLHRLEAITAATGDGQSSSFSRILRPAHEPNWTRGCADLVKCLSAAPPWQDITQRLLHEIAAHSDAELRVGAFCPENTLWALDYLFRGQEGYVLPSLQMLYQHEEIHRVVQGTLIWDGTVAAGFEQVVTSVYETAEDFFLWSSTVPDADLRLCTALGLRFDVVEFSPGNTNPKRLHPHEISELVREEFDMDDPHNQSVAEFMAAHQDFLIDLAMAFDRYTWRPGIPRIEDLLQLTNTEPSDDDEIVAEDDI